jgi:hypothetical protein
LSFDGFHLDLRDRSIGFCHGFVPNSLLRGLLCDNFTTRKSLFARVGGLLLRQHRLLFRDCFTLDFGLSYDQPGARLGDASA